MAELKIIEEKENPLFSRKEVKAEFESEVTPSKVQISEEIAKKYSTQPEVVKVLLIDANFGENKVKIDANIYLSKDEKEKYEIKEKKEKEAEEAKQQEQQAQQEESTESKESSETSEDKSSESDQGTEESQEKSE